MIIKLIKLKMKSAEPAYSLGKERKRKFVLFSDSLRSARRLYDQDDEECWPIVVQQSGQHDTQKEPTVFVSYFWHLPRVEWVPRSADPHT